MDNDLDTSNDYSKSFNYNDLKESYMIVMEVRNYIVLNDGRILVKGKDETLTEASEDNEFVKEIRSLLNKKIDSDEVRRIDRRPDGNEEPEP